MSDSRTLQETQTIGIHDVPKGLQSIIAELQRAKRASGAPWVRKFGKPPSRENLVIT